VHTLEAGDELGWSSVLSGRGKFYQARALEPVETVRFDGYQLLEKCRSDHFFGYKIMHRLVGVVSERLQAARMQVLDMYSPIAKKAGA
jgi:CRP-like cAMP-binding protein